MAEVLVEFDAAFPGADGATYTPRACTRLNDDGLWEGWLEFTDLETKRRTGAWWRRRELGPFTGVVGRQ